MTLFDKASIDSIQNGTATAKDRETLMRSLCHGIDVLGELPLLLEARKLLGVAGLTNKEIKTIEHALVLVDLGMRG